MQIQKYPLFFGGVLLAKGLIHFVFEFGCVVVEEIDDWAIHFDMVFSGYEVDMEVVHALDIKMELRRSLVIDEDVRQFLHHQVGDFVELHVDGEFLYQGVLHIIEQVDREDLYVEHLVVVASWHHLGADVERRTLHEEVAHLEP